MKRIFCIVSLSACALTGFAQTAPPTTPPAVPPSAVTPANPARPAKTKKTTTPARPLAVMTIPPDAVKTSDGSYRYTDPQGRKWIYNQTPFGVSRYADKPQAAAGDGPIQTPFGPSKRTGNAAPSAVTGGDPNERVTAIAKGDTIQFQRPSPFGVTSWQKNKNELTADEQKIWEREQGKGTH